jgi:hypothetical protein
MTDEFIPWGKQDPTLHEGDIKLYGDKNAILSKSYRWPNAQIPYQISAEYSKHFRHFKFLKHFLQIINYLL